VGALSRFGPLTRIIGETDTFEEAIDFVRRQPYHQNQFLQLASGDLISPKGLNGFIVLYKNMLVKGHPRIQNNPRAFYAEFWYSLSTGMGMELRHKLCKQLLGG